MRLVKDRQLFAAVLLSFGMLVAIVNWKWSSFSPDLSALFMASRFFFEGQFDLIYAHPEGFFGNLPPQWEPYLAELGLQDDVPLPYLYPPLWAAVFAPLAGMLDAQMFFNFVGLGLIAAFAASVPVSWRLAREFGMPLSNWVLISALTLPLSMVAFISLMHLQVQILVTFLVIFAFERHAHGHSRMAGGALALAAALKLAPAIFVLLFVLEKDWRAVKSFTLWGGLLGVSSLLAGGIDLHWQMFDALSAAVDQIYVSGATISAEVIFYTLAGLIGLTDAMDLSARNQIFTDSHFAVDALIKIIAVAVAFWVIAATAKLDHAKRVTLRLVLLSLLLNMFGPLGWAQYYLLQILFLPLVLAIIPGVGGWVFLLVFAMLTSWPVIVLLQIGVAGDIPVIAVVIASFTGFFLTLMSKLPLHIAQDASLSVPAE